MKIEALAIAKYLRISPSKIQRLLDKIRGKRYIESLKILKLFPQKSGSAVFKVLNSAANNAIVNQKMIKENLIIDRAFVNQGPILKRIRARAKGKSAKIEKKMCHITIFLTEKIKN